MRAGPDLRDRFGPARRVVLAAGIATVAVLSAALVLGSPSAHPQLAPHAPVAGRGGGSAATLPASCAPRHPSERMPIRPIERALALSCANLAARSGAVAAPAAPSPSWTAFGVVPPPFELYNFEMTYDARDGYVLLFGDVIAHAGVAAGSPETWAYHAGIWTRQNVTKTPTNCIGSMLTYDEIDGYAVFLGGSNLTGGPTCPSANQTWTYSAGLWNRLPLSSGPSAREFGAFTNDSKDGYLLLFGGLGGHRGTTLLADTWKFVGGSWSRINTAGPGARYGSGMTYDAADGYVLLFGGTWAYGCLNASGDNLPCQVRDTWSYSNGTWSRINTHGVAPPEPYDDGLVYDAVDRVALYTVADDNSSYRNDPEIYWSYHAGRWTSYDASSFIIGTRPPDRLGEGLAYDWGDGVGILFGGTAGDWKGMDDTWLYHATTWRPLSPLPRIGAAIAFDPLLHATVLFGGRSPMGGYVYNDTWEYSGGVWARLNPIARPPGRDGAALAYDPGGRYLVLFGGCPAAAPYCYSSLNDTWKFANGSWTNLSPTPSPSARGFGAMAYDGKDGYLVLFGGERNYAATYYPTDTWKFHAGLWTNITYRVHPSGRAAESMVYDPADGYLVLFGGCNGSYAYYSNLCTPSTPGIALSDTWKFVRGVWSSISVTGPPGRFAAAAAYSPVLGAVVLFGGEDSSARFSNDTWDFSAGSWTRLAPATAPPAQAGSALESGAPNGALTLFQSTTLASYQIGIWRFQ